MASEACSQISFYPSERICRLVKLDRLTWLAEVGPVRDGQEGFPQAHHLDQVVEQIDRGAVAMALMEAKHDAGHEAADIVLRDQDAVGLGVQVVSGGEPDRFRIGPAVR
ncbi:hypothetical protein [Bradyrhizobium sp. SZCCHNS3051]|uniref:hypothetical protein n=1 Tax=Bradyrhizobium TaxID=374 RepID=UPI0029165773|nr:hypothetical protein [Bradyrhizobium sp. SZCCHNS3051]